VDPMKITTITTMLVLVSVIEIKRFLGLASFYQCYFWDFASKVAPMCKLLKKNEEFKWTKACNKSWEWMKTFMTCLLILMVPNCKIKFHVHIDATNFALRVMLDQNPNNTINKPIYYVSRLMNSVKKNYTTTKKEALTMIYVVKKFKHYSLGNSFIFFVDHQTLLYLVNKLTVSSWIAKWLLMLQEFDFKVVYKLGQVHFLPNHLFRISHGE